MSDSSIATRSAEVHSTLLQVCSAACVELRPYRVPAETPAGQCAEFRRSILRWSQDFSLGFADPAPSQERLHAFYAEEYRSVMGKARGFAAYVQSPVYRTQAKSLVSWALPHVTARGAWLDVGAAFGLLLWQVRNDLPDWSLYAIEPAGDARDALAQLASVDTDFAAFWEGRSGPMAFYDVISLSHVLEHLLDPFSALRLLRERLKPGGLLVLEVPNDHRLELTRATRSSDLPHLWFFSGEGLRRVVELSGFEILREAELGLRRPGSRAPLHRRAARWLRRKLRGDLSLCDDGDWYAERPDRCNLRLLCRRSA